MHNAHHPLCELEPCTRNCESEYIPGFPTFTSEDLDNPRLNNDWSVTPEDE